MKNLSQVTFQNLTNCRHTQVSKLFHEVYLSFFRVAATEHPNQWAIFELCFDKGFKKSSPFIQA